MKKQKQDERAITLIALVITIIILLILAGVTILTLTGDNGLLERTKMAREETKKATAKEKVKIAVLASYETEGNIDKIQLIENLKNTEGIDINSIPDVNEDFLWNVSVDGYQVTIYENGKVTIGNESIGGENTPNPPEEKLAKDILKTNPDAEDESSKSPFVKYNGINCRVLYNDETHGLQIITANNMDAVHIGKNDNTVTASDFPYDGSAELDDTFKITAASYNNAIDKLNNKAKTYMDKNGIAIDARCLGSIPTLTNESKFYGDTSEMWNPGYWWITTYKWEGKFKSEDENYLEDAEKMNNLNLITTSHTLLASREITDSSIENIIGLRYLSSAR